MAIKVKVSIVPAKLICRLPEKEITIPSVCPECGADLTESGSLVDCGLVWYSSRGQIARDGDKSRIECDGSFIECDGSFEEYFESAIRTDCVCSTCDHSFAGE